MEQTFLKFSSENQSIQHPVCSESLSSIMIFIKIGLFRSVLSNASAVFLSLMQGPPNVEHSNTMFAIFLNFKMFDVWMFANIRLFGCSLIFEYSHVQCSLIFDCSKVRMFANIRMFACSMFECSLIFFSKPCSCVRIFDGHERTFNIEHKCSLFGGLCLDDHIENIC